jgi:hypothetical protein
MPTPAARRRRRILMTALAAAYVLGLVAVGTNASFRELPAKQPAPVAALAAAR